MIILDVTRGPHAVVLVRILVTHEWKHLCQIRMFSEILHCVLP